MNNKIKIFLYIIAVLTIVGASNYVFANPGSNPPQNSPYPPIHSGLFGQTKLAGLTIASSPVPVGLVVANGSVSIGSDLAPTGSSTSVLVNGTVKIAGGSPGQDKVLVSDSNGIGSWVTASGYLNKKVIMAFDGVSCPSGWSKFTDADGRVIVGTGDSVTTGSSDILLGSRKGTEKEILDNNEIPAHEHSASLNKGDNNGIDESGDNVLSGGGRKTTGMFSPSGIEAIQEPHNNMQPYLVATYCYKDL